MKKLWALSSVVLLLAMVLSACGGSDSSANQKVTLRYAIWGTGQTATMQKIADEFQKTHPNITIKIESNSYANYWTKLETAATGGSAPDVFWMNGPRFVKYASNGILQSLDDLGQVDYSKYPSSLVQLYTYNGKHYALPKDFDTVGLWYNKTLFDAAGVKYPDDTWTWSTLQDAAKKLTNASKGVWGIAAQQTDQEGFYNTIPQNGGFVISPDHKTSGFGSDAAIGGLQFWTDMIKNGSSPTLAQQTDTPALSMFESGKVAMIYAGSWDAIEFGQNSYTKDKVDVTVLPMGKTRATVIHGLGNVVYANTSHPKEAWEWEQFLGSKEAADIEASTGAVIPAYNGTQDAWVKAYPTFHVQSYLDELSYAVPYPVSKNTAAWNDVQNTILNKVWAGDLSVSDGAHQLQQQMDALLSKE